MKLFKLQGKEGKVRDIMGAVPASQGIHWFWLKQLIPEYLTVTSSSLFACSVGQVLVKQSSSVPTHSLLQCPNTQPVWADASRNLWLAWPCFDSPSPAAVGGDSQASNCHNSFWAGLGGLQGFAKPAPSEQRPRAKSATSDQRPQATTVALTSLGHSTSCILSGSS